MENELFNNFKFDLGPLEKSSTSPFDEDDNLNTEYFAQYWDKRFTKPEFKFDKLDFDFSLVETEDDGDAIYDYIEVVINVPFYEDKEKVRDFIDTILKEFSIDPVNIFMQRVK